MISEENQHSGAASEAELQTLSSNGTSQAAPHAEDRPPVLADRAPVPRIPKENYLSEAVFQAEMRRIFQRGYQFLALTTELANHKDFVCVDFFGCSIVVQNFRGTIKAFENICTHRFNKIQVEDRGNRALNCMYHGWTFNMDGCPIGVAKREDFASEGVNEADLCLTQYEVETCGKFLFAKLHQSPGTLRDYLGSYYDDLEEISAHMGQEVLYETLSHKANWKLLAENVLDEEHCAVAHRDSFVPAGYCTKPVARHRFAGPHSSGHNIRSTVQREGARKIFLSHLSNRGYVHDSYFHINIFPNLYVASTEGIAFYVGQTLPISAEETILRVRYFEPAVELSPKHRARQDQLNADTNANGIRILNEDRAILENIQRGMRMSAKPGVVWRGETRVRNFFDHYTKLMADG